MIFLENVTRWKAVTQEESIEVPKELVKLVNGPHPKWGRNGHLYMGCQRADQGGPVIDRLREYLQHHQNYHVLYGHPCNCPVNPEEKDPPQLL